MKTLPKSGKSGFTFFEAFCVIILLLVLAAFLRPPGGTPFWRAQKNSNQARIHNLHSAIRLYQLDCGGLPPALKSLIVNPGIIGWKGPYITEGKSLKDPWGSPYLYQNRENRYLLFCSGPPGKNQDDVEVKSSLSSPVLRGKDVHTFPEPTSNCTPQGSRPTVTPR